MSAANEAAINAFIGASGSGKSSRIKIELAALRPTRLLVWDVKREWSPLGLDSFDSLAGLAKVLFKRKKFALAFHPIRSTKAMREQFSTFCKLADAAGDLVCVNEELADVTLAGWAPEGWSMLTRQGRHSKMVIYGTTQSPASIDKTFLANASRISCGALGSLSDVKTMANMMMVDKARILSLLPMQFINLDKSTREITEGTTDKKIIEGLKRIT